MYSPISNNLFFYNYTIFSLLWSKNQTFKCVITVSDTHKHNWEPVIKKIWVKEKGHFEKKKVPYQDYEYTHTTYCICAVCGGRFETDADIIAHFDQQAALVETTGEFGPCAFASTTFAN